MACEFFTDDDINMPEECSGGSAATAGCSALPSLGKKRALQNAVG
jgi:hypothetical protein